MAIQKRIITPELEALYHTKPVDTLSNQELFQVLQFGTRTFQAKAEVLSRLQSDPNFIYRLFDFGRNHIDPLRTKFDDLFNCSMPSAANLDIQIVNEIAKNINFKDDVKRFAPTLISDDFYDMPSRDVFMITNAYMNIVDDPMVLIGSNKNMFLPIKRVFENLCDMPDNHIVLAETITNYINRFRHLAGSNPFAVNPTKAMLYAENYIYKFFEGGLKDIKRMAAFAQAISCLTNSGCKYTISHDASDIQKLCSSTFVPDEEIIKIVREMVQQDGFDRLSLVGEIDSRRTLNIISNFVSREECFKLGKRNVRGFMLEDELGL